VRDRPARSAILLNRCIARAHSTTDAREALEGLGYDVLGTAVPRLEVYAQSFGSPIKDTGREVWRHVAHDLIERSFPSVRNGRDHPAGTAPGADGGGGRAAHRPRRTPGRPDRDQGRNPYGSPSTSARSCTGS